MRKLLSLILVAFFTLPAFAAELGPDGLHEADWLRETFKDLQEDAAEAKAEGKRLMILVEQRGCSYCKKMHETTFQDPRVLQLLKEDFFPVRINLHGGTEVTDTDGEVLTEKSISRRWGVLFTPTMILMPGEVDLETPAIAQAAAMMPGAFSASTTFDLLTWVKEDRYLDQSEEDFQRYHARMIKERGGVAGD